MEGTVQYKKKTKARVHIFTRASIYIKEKQAAGAWHDHPSPYITEAEERLEQYTSPDFHDLLQSELYLTVLLSTFLFRHTNIIFWQESAPWNQYTCYVAWETKIVFFSLAHDRFIRCVSGMKQDSSFRLEFQTSLLSEALQKVMQKCTLQKWSCSKILVCKKFLLKNQACWWRAFITVDFKFE